MVPNSLLSFLLGKNEKAYAYLRDHLVVEFLTVLGLLERQVYVLPFVAVIHVVDFEAERPQQISVE